ncbi:unnamed protein product [Vicia faba]|uniref:S-protein homolog n=1 Tax=Vicia faba TaxID=3906 RepID=A0AAV0ZGF9_VICFA|nr:unnamed protein product [Vicia faba]
MDELNTIFIKFSILLIVIVSLETNVTSVKVIIINDIQPNPSPTGSIPLYLHCKSKDNDLGFHTLGIFGQSYQFSFNPSFPVIKTTLFFCSFAWPESSLHHYLDIYDYDRDSCTECIWKINKNGGSMFGVFHPWKSIGLMDRNSTSMV